MRSIIFTASSLLYSLHLAAAQLPDFGNLAPCVETCVPQALAQTQCTQAKGSDAVLFCICHGTNGSRFSDSLITCLTKECGMDAEAIIIAAGSLCDNAPEDVGMIVPITSTQSSGMATGGPTMGTSSATVSDISRGEPQPTASFPSVNDGTPSSVPSATTAVAGAGTTGGVDSTKVVSDATSTGATGSSTSSPAAAPVVVPGMGILGAGVIALVAALV